MLQALKDNLEWGKVTRYLVYILVPLGLLTTEQGDQLLQHLGDFQMAVAGVVSLAAIAYENWNSR